MAETLKKAKTGVQRSSWIILLTVGILATLSALYVALTPAGSQTELTDRTWESFMAADPEVATIFERLLSLAGLSGVGFGLFGILTTWFAFRLGQRWAWFAMWLFPIMYGVVAVRMLADAYEVGYWYTAMTLLSLPALLIPIRRFF